MSRLGAKETTSRLSQRWMVLVDIDNTIAESSLRIHPRNKAEWMRRLAEPIRPIRKAVKALMDVAKLADIAFVSGRPAYTLKLTELWLRRHTKMRVAGIHLCPDGLDSEDYKAAIFREYEQNGYKDRVCMIDDTFAVPGYLVFVPPRGWGKMVEFLKENMEMRRD